MNDIEFAAALRDEVNDALCPHYKKALIDFPLESDDDIYGKAGQALRVLSDADQKAILEFFRVTMIDAVSTVLGAIDGTSFPSSFSGELELLCDGEAIQGDLQDLFLQGVET